MTFSHFSPTFGLLSKQNDTFALLISSILHDIRFKKRNFAEISVGKA
jgi:hypothetical protein